MKYTIDAENKKLGRVASEVAKTLLGKLNPSFKKNEVADVTVEVINAEKMDITEKKKEEKEYVSFSGYPGGQKILTMNNLIAKFGMEEVLKRAIYKMLPKNRLQDKRIKLLKISK